MNRLVTLLAQLWRRLDHALRLPAQAPVLVPIPIRDAARERRALHRWPER